LIVVTPSCPPAAGGSTLAGRVGAFDSRHPGLGEVMQCMAAATTPEARLLIDSGQQLHELPIVRTSSDTGDDSLRRSSTEEGSKRCR
jgi:hypothetical protein